MPKDLNILITGASRGIGNAIAKIVDSLFDLSEQAVVEELIVRPMLGDVDE